MNSLIWTGLGIATYNCVVILSNYISRKKDPGAFSGPIIPLVGILFIIASFLFYPISLIQIPVAIFVLVTELIFSFPMMKNTFEEMMKAKSALIIYPTPPATSREHDFYS